MTRKGVWSLVLALFVMTAVVNGQQLGSIEFPNSGSEAAQEAFIRGVLLLHNFEYEDALESFLEARAQDPTFAMTWWGEAMCYNHPLWRGQDLHKGREILASFGTTPEQRNAKIPTDRERGYFRALELLYGEGDKLERDLAYSEAMRELSERYPKDLEAASFYALSILGTRQGERDFATYMKSGAIVEEVFAANPLHPGAAHYLIHSYDDPIHAPLGLRAARVYAQIAPEASHAQHMVSHIFIALGHWAEASRANVLSFQVSEERARSKGQPRGNHHALLWLSYSLLQEGRHQRAAEKLVMMDEDTRLHPTPPSRWHLVMMRAGYGVETGEWQRVADPIDTGDLNWSGIAAHDFTLVMAALDREDLAKARSIRDRLREVIGQEPNPGSDFYTTTGPSDRLAAKVVERQVSGLLSLAVDEPTQGLKELAEAVEIESSMPLTFGPPVVVKPSHELYGEVLLARGRFDEAQLAFSQSLERAPRRAASLVGLLRVARGSGNQSVAASIDHQLGVMWSHADEHLVSSVLRSDRLAAGDSP